LQQNIPLVYVSYVDICLNRDLGRFLGYIKLSQQSLRDRKDKQDFMKISN